MTVQYTNRVGKTYYLREGKTKTGKPRYFFSSQQDGKGELIDQIPAGYETYEHPENAQVFLHKTRPKLITDIEKHLVEKHMEQLTRSKRYRVDCKDEYITIYESDADIGELKDLLGDFLKHTSLRSGINADEAMNALVGAANQNHTAMLRFHLIDKERRIFMAQRFCFRGGIDDWILLGGPEKLKKLIGKYIKLLGTDDFYDAPYF
ncbi:MAG: hypothetical protein KJP23_10685 [Deltaproteobacteria bacterium]|nr:hypothetical protein [Deltaproteobacteria bacterium]